MAPTLTSSPSRAPARASAAIDAQPAQTPHRLGLRAVVVEVRERHGPLGGSAQHHPSALAGALDVEALGDRAMHDDLARCHGGRLATGVVDQRGQPRYQGRDALARGRRERHVAHALVVGHHVGLAAHDHPGAFEQLGAVRAELGKEDAQLRRGGHAAQLGRREVDQHHEHPRPLDVAEELVPQTLAGRRALDEAGDVRHHELGAVAHPAHTDHAEVRFERGERVVGDLRFGRRHGRDQRRLPRVGKAHQCHVRHQFELHVQPELLALLTLLGEGRGPATIREEACIAAPALTAFGHQAAGTLGGQVADHPTLAVAYDGPDGYWHNEVLAACTVALGARAVHAVGGAPERVVAEAQQRGLVHRRHEPDVAAVPPVAAVGSTPVHMGLAAPRHRPGSPIAGARVQLGLVDEAGHGGKA